METCELKLYVNGELRRTFRCLPYFIEELVTGFLFICNDIENGYEIPEILIRGDGAVKACVSPNGRGPVEAGEIEADAGGLARFLQSVIEKAGDGRCYAGAYYGGRCVCLMPGASMDEAVYRAVGHTVLHERPVDGIALATSAQATREFIGLCAKALVPIALAQGRADITLMQYAEENGVLLFCADGSGGLC